MFLLEEIIFSDDKDHKIFCAICSAVGYNDDVVDHLLTLLEDYNRTIEFLKWAISDEIEQKSVEPGTLFRSNTIATKFISYYFQRYGKDYLKLTLQTKINSVIKENLPWEVDAEKLEPGFDVEQNMNRLMTTCKEFLDIIVSSIDRVPKQFRVILNYIRKSVGARFPEMMDKMVGAFFFLRFLCPAIVTPDRYGLVPTTPPNNARRGLVLISKLLQNLANHQEFDGVKEDYMAFSNEFIKKTLIL